MGISYGDFNTIPTYMRKYLINKIITDNSPNES